MEQHDKNYVVGAVLKGIRESKSITQKAMEEICDRSASHISCWERGEVDIPSLVINAYSQKTNIHLQEIQGLIDKYKKRYEDFVRDPKNYNIILMPSFRDKVCREIKEMYGEDPYELRTRREFKGNIKLD